jgi:hypothetical protein
LRDEAVYTALIFPITWQKENTQINNEREIIISMSLKIHDAIDDNADDDGDNRAYKRSTIKGCSVV